MAMFGIFRTKGKLNDIREGTLHAAEEKGAADQSKHRHRDCDPKDGWVQRAAAEHRPAKAFNKPNDWIEREQRLPERRNDFARWINNWTR